MGADRECDSIPLDKQRHPNSASRYSDHTARQRTGRTALSSLLTQSKIRKAEARSDFSLRVNASQAVGALFAVLACQKERSVLQLAAQFTAELVGLLQRMTPSTDACAPAVSCDACGANKPTDHAWSIDHVSPRAVRAAQIVRLIARSRTNAPTQACCHALVCIARSPLESARNYIDFMVDAGIIEAVLKTVEGRFVAAAPEANGATGAAGAEPAQAAAADLEALRERRALQAEATELLLDVVKMSVTGLARGQSCPVLKLCGEIKEDITAAQGLRKRFGNVRAALWRSASPPSCCLQHLSCTRMRSGPPHCCHASSTRHLRPLSAPTHSTPVCSGPAPPRTRL